MVRGSFAGKYRTEERFDVFQFTSGQPIPIKKTGEKEKNKLRSKLSTSEEIRNKSKDQLETLLRKISSSIVNKKMINEKELQKEYGAAVSYFGVYKRKGIVQGDIENFKQRYHNLMQIAEQQGILC